MARSRRDVPVTEQRIVNPSGCLASSTSNFKTSPISSWCCLYSNPTGFVAGSLRLLVKVMLENSLEFSHQ